MALFHNTNRRVFQIDPYDWRGYEIGQQVEMEGQPFIVEGVTLRYGEQNAQAWVACRHGQYDEAGMVVDNRTCEERGGHDWPPPFANRIAPCVRCGKVFDNT